MGIATLTKSAELLSPELHVVTDDELQQLHHVLLDMMNDIADVCKEHNIPWILTGGSALGAVRHNGFIPWDDDIDISMFREGFERFKTVFPEKYSDKYELTIPGDAGYLYHFPKIYRKNTTALNIQSAQDTEECVSIDIFIMENASNSTAVRTLHGFLCTVLLMIVSVMRMKRCEHNLLKYGANSKKLCTAVKRRAFFAAFLSFLSLEQWLKITDKSFSLCKDINSEHIVIPSGNRHFFGELFLRKKMCTIKAIDFSGNPYFVPEDPDYYLRIRYGEEYMKIPPETDKEQHAFIQFDLGSLK